MKTQILPNWCKKLALILFMIASLLNGSLNFINNSINKYKIKTPEIDASELGTQSNSDNRSIRAFKHVFGRRLKLWN